MEYVGRHRRLDRDMIRAICDGGDIIAQREAEAILATEPCIHPGVFSLFTDTADYVHCGQCNTLVPRHLL